MNFLAFQKHFRDYPIFSTHDMRLLLRKENPDTINKQISDWAKQGKLVKLKNGLYTLSEDFTKEPIKAEWIAARLYQPSYLSLQKALACYGMIPEAVFETTCVTTKPTRMFNTPFGRFRYQTVKPSCFFGFHPVKQGKFSYDLATAEKALLDFLYLNTHRLRPEPKTWEAMRLQHLKRLNLQCFSQMAKKFESQKLSALVASIKKYATST